jgi:hypothetical protein
MNSNGNVVEFMPVGKLTGFFLKMEKKKGTIEIEYLKSLEYPFCVNFWGHNEGSGSPCKNEEEVQREVNYLLLKNRMEYSITIKDKRAKQSTLNLGG